MPWLGVISFAIMAGWLLSPVATSTHVEVFSARLQSQAISDAQGELALDEQAYPVVTGYMYTSKLGVVHALELIMHGTGTGDASFRLLMWLSDALFIASCVVFARRWGEVPVWAALAFLILTPGLVEVSFFFADNLPSAAVACLALALIAPSASWVRWSLIGALFALATLMRLDALLIAPSILLVSWLAEDGRLKRLAAGWLCAVAGATLVFVASWKLLHVSLLQSIAIGRWFAGFHLERSDPFLATVMAAFGFFGLAPFLLFAAGVRRNAQARGRAWNVCLSICPTALYLIFIPKAPELRDFLLLGAPFLLLQGGAGLASLPRLYRDSAPATRFSIQVTMAACLLLLVAPPIVIMRDGPRTFTGRLWSPILWREWQRSVEDGLATCDSAIAAATPGRPVLIVTTMFNADGYLHLRLLQQGFRVEPDAASSASGMLLERYVKGDLVVLEVRTEDPYELLSSPPSSLPHNYVADFELKTALAAVHPTDYDQAFLLTWGTAAPVQRFIAPTPQFERAAGPQEIVLPDRTWMPACLRGRYGRMRAIPLSHEDVRQLQAFATQQVQTAELHHDATWHPLGNVGELRRRLQSRYWHP